MGFQAGQSLSDSPNLSLRPACRLCGKTLRHTVVDLGKSPPCESFRQESELGLMEAYYPLHVRVCEECMLVQLEEFVSPETIFEEYAYFSSYSTSWVAHAERYCEHMIERFGLNARSFVVELASNDGYLLQHFVARGIPVLGVEPSCLAVLRSDAAELVDDPRLVAVSAATRTLAELLGETPGYTPPDLTGLELVVQPHCHHASVLGWQADAALLAGTGATVTTLGACCGLAGNIGVERGHYEVSVAVAEDQLLPAIRAAGPDAILLADGFSCRTQVADVTGRRALTLAELLAAPPVAVPAS